MIEEQNKNRLEIRPYFYVCFGLTGLSLIIIIFFILYTLIVFKYKPFGYYLSLNLLIFSALNCLSYLLSFKSKKIIKRFVGNLKNGGLLYFYSSIGMEISSFYTVFNLFNNTINKFFTKLKFSYKLLIITSTYFLPLLIVFSFFMINSNLNPINRWLYKVIISDEITKINEFSLYCIRFIFFIVSMILTKKIMGILHYEYNSIKKMNSNKNISFNNYVILALGYPVLSFISFIIPWIISGLELFSQKESVEMKKSLVFIAIFIGVFQSLLFSICFSINTNILNDFLRKIPCCRGLYKPEQQKIESNDGDSSEDDHFNETSISCINSLYGDRTLSS